MDGRHPGYTLLGAGCQTWAGTWVTSVHGPRRPLLLLLSPSPLQDIFDKVDKSGEGVCVQASTLGSLEALLAFLDSKDVGIPVSGINIGPVHKRDVLRANVMAEKGVKKVRRAVF